MQPILKVNLTMKTHTTILIPEDWQRDYIGAASLAARILYERINKNLDPLSPDAPLLFLTGPLTGTAGPSAGRFVICARSPATGLWGESNCGGFWGPELRKAGFDGLLLAGRADAHVYLWIHDKTIEIKDASHLWERCFPSLGDGYIPDPGCNFKRIACEKTSSCSYWTCW